MNQLKIGLFVAISLLTACTADDVSQNEEAATELDAVSAEERLAYIRMSQVWSPSTIADKDLYNGPKAEDAYEHDELVVCKFREPKKAGEMNGKTPKFKCEGCEDGCTVPIGENVKVKYGKTAADNGEIYGEIMSTRLQWSLGFEADRVYPVRVLCKNCPEDPWAIYRDFRPGSGARADRTFEFAVIEIKNDGEKIETTEDQGWSWDELELVDESAGGAPKAQLDALRLLASFMYHADNKPENQRIICKEESADGRCSDPFMMIQDAGTSFGSTKLLGLGYRKAELGAWSQQSVWKDRSRCQARMTSIHELSNPIVSEEGRKFLADLMAQLSDEQLRAMFAASNVEERGEQIEVDGVTRPATVDDWVATFKKKRDELMLPCGSP